MECVVAAPFHLSWQVALEIGGIENEAKWAGFENSFSIARAAEHLAELALRENPSFIQASPD